MSVRVIKNKRNIFNIIAVSLGATLLISISILFSSFRNFLIYEVKHNVGDYHVIINGKIKKDSSILKKEFKNDRYFITYKNIYNVYRNTERICKECRGITYNDSLLSLYGISKNKNVLNTLKKIVYFITISLGIIIFFIIYNSFNSSLNSRKKDICQMRLIGFTVSDLYKYFFKESFLIGVFGTIIGFIFSIILNLIAIKILNIYLYEVFNNHLFIGIYIPFIIISILLMILIIFLSSIIPFKNIKKYKPIELFKKTFKIENSYSLYKNVTFWFSLLNYNRNKRRYKGLVFSVFIVSLSISVFSLVMKYTLTLTSEFVKIPEYDLFVKAENYDLKKISKDLKSDKMITFKACQGITSIPKDNYLINHKDFENITITNLGGNKIINNLDKIDKYNGKIKHYKSSRFKSLNEVKVEKDREIKINDLSLTSKHYFGLSDFDDVIINLNNDKFNTVCDDYQNYLIIKTKHNGIDKYFNNLIKKGKINISYINVKKSVRIIKSIFLTIKLFITILCILIFIVMIMSSINNVSLALKQREDDINCIKSLGMENKRLIVSFIIESFIISFKGWLFSLPFIFIANKYIFISIKEVFIYNNRFYNLEIIILCLIVSFLSVFFTMVVSYKKNM